MTNRDGVSVVLAGEDRQGVRRSMGITSLAFKVTTDESCGDFFVVEQTAHAKGGPPRHVHPDQDEWFYVIDGTFVVEIDDRTHHLSPGDSLLAPRGIPHVWAFVGEATGRLLVAFTPAGKMEAFFLGVTKTSAMPSQDPAVWLAHGMQVTGPPLLIDS